MSLSQEYYFKLKTLAETFGINATAVLIADIDEESGRDTASVNQMQIERGEMLDVVTVWKQADIGNIGNTLLSILNSHERMK